MAGFYTNAVGAKLFASASPTKAYVGTKVFETFTGTAANEAFRAVGGDVMVGGLGDDTYFVSNPRDVVIEWASQGTDTVVSYIPSVVLADNVENLTVQGNDIFGTGNGLDNILTAVGARVTLNGGAGNDVLVGATATVFSIVSGNGSDAIYNWSGGDIIRLTGYGVSSFAQVQSIMHQAGNATVLDFANGESLVLNGVQASSLTEANFQLPVDTSRMRPTFADEFNGMSFYDSRTKTGTWNTDFSLSGTHSMVGHTIIGVDSVFVDPQFAGRADHALGINPFSTSNGILTISAAPTPTDMLQYVDNRSYTGGLLTTRGSFSQEYGYFEIRAAMPAGQGLYSAFWMLPTDGSWPPELDVFEVLGKDPGKLMMTSHDSVGGKNIYDTLTQFIDTTQMHTYGVDWGPKTIKYYIDGVEVAEQATPASMKKEMYMLVNEATGPKGSWIGGTDSTTGVGQLKVDYVRAYQTADTVSSTINGVHTVYPAGSFSPPVAGGGSGGTVTPPPPPPPPPAHPVAADDSGFSTPYGVPLSISAASLVANDTGSGRLAVTAVDSADHGSVALVNGKIVFTPDALYSGQASFGYTVTDGSGQSDHATVSLSVGAEARPASLYIHGSGGADLVDKSGSSLGWMVNGDSGNDTILGGQGANSLNGGAGNDRIIGGAGADVITGGLGADILTGAGGNDTFVFSATDIGSVAAGTADRITDFHRLGSGAERDVVRITGFGADAGVTGIAANADGSFTYHVSDGNRSGDIIILSTGGKLGAADFIFA